MHNREKNENRAGGGIKLIVALVGRLIAYGKRHRIDNAKIKGAKEIKDYNGTIKLVKYQKY